MEYTKLYLSKCTAKTELKCNPLKTNNRIQPDKEIFKMNFDNYSKKYGYTEITAEMTVDKLMELTALTKQLLEEGHSIRLFDRFLDENNSSEELILGLLTRSFWKITKEINNYVHSLEVSREKTFSELEGETKKEKIDSLITNSSNDGAEMHHVFDITLAEDENDYAYIYPYVSFENGKFIVYWATHWEIDRSLCAFRYMKEKDLMSALTIFVEGMAKHFIPAKS